MVSSFQERLQAGRGWSSKCLESQIRRGAAKGCVWLKSPGKPGMSMLLTSYLWWKLCVAVIVS